MNQERINLKMMDLALLEAKRGLKNDEVPVGAVITLNGEIISTATNSCENDKDCTCHAEINAIKGACNKLKSKTLENCEMYLTLEPCAMCTGAIINARIKRLYIGAPEPKTGCCGSVVNLLQKGLFNHSVEVYFGFSEDESRDILKEFFEGKRKKD